MALLTYDLDDGSILVVNDDSDYEPGAAAPAASTLGGIADTVADFAVNLAASGTWALLGALAMRLRQEGIARRRPSTADEAVQMAISTLDALGVGIRHFDAVERSTPDSFWVVTGVADGRAFVLQIDPSGVVQRIRFSPQA
jgi:hypothetical protein